MLLAAFAACGWSLATTRVLAQTSQDFVYARKINSDPVLLLQQGTALLRANRNEEAAVKFERLCAINPHSARGHYQWGLALLKLGRTVEATDQLRQAIRIDPQLADAWLTLAGVYQATGDTDQAINTYNEFIRRFPQDNDAQRAGGLVELLNRQKLANLAVAPVAALPGAGLVPYSESGTRERINPAYDSQPRTAQMDYYQEVTRHGTMRWVPQQMPLRVFIQTNSAIEGYCSQYATILQSAFLNWTHRSQGLISVVFTQEPAQSDIICNWTANIARFNPEGEAAETRLYGGQSGLTRGEIEILVTDISSKKPLTEEQMRGIALHEVGHVLGLAGHSNNEGDIMFFAACKANYWRDISPRDEATIVRLYNR